MVRLIEVLDNQKPRSLRHSLSHMIHPSLPGYTLRYSSHDIDICIFYGPFQLFFSLYVLAVIGVDLNLEGLRKEPPST
jgi:hypothetical protein